MSKKRVRANNSRTWWMEFGFAALAIVWGLTGGTGKGPLGKALLYTGMEHTWEVLMVGGGYLCIAVLLAEHCINRSGWFPRAMMMCAYLRTTLQGLFFMVWGYVIKFALTTDVLADLYFVPRVAPIMLAFHLVAAIFNWRVANALDPAKPTTDVLSYERAA